MSALKYGSVCSGIEAASVAWKPLGWECKFLAEVEPFPCLVLNHRQDASKPLRLLDPAEAEDEKERKERELWARRINSMQWLDGSVPNLGDFTKIQENDYDGTIDLLVGGTPCQSYSVAGLRKGLADPRGNLALEFTRLAYRAGARWVVWENVPGVLSSGAGGDFASFLSLLCGWEVPVPRRWWNAGISTGAPGCFGVAWRVFDTQYTRISEFPRAIPQRRRRVILVGHLGSWERAASVLFEHEMCGGTAPPRRENGETAAAGAEGGVERDPCKRGPTWWDGGQVAATLLTNSQNQRMPDTGKLPYIIDGVEKERIEACGQSLDMNYGCPTLEETSHTLKCTTAPGYNPVVIVRGGVLPIDDMNTLGRPNSESSGLCIGEEGDPCPTITKQHHHGVCYPLDTMHCVGRHDGCLGVGDESSPAPTITKAHSHAVCDSDGGSAPIVRRLLPVECERLMGFPDGYTSVPFAKDGSCPDGPRYKSLGNSMSTNVMSWVGHRIDEVEAANG